MPTYCSITASMSSVLSLCVLQVPEDPWGNNTRQVRPCRSARVSRQSCVFRLQRRSSGSVPCIDSYYPEPQLWSQLLHITNSMTPTTTFWSRISLSSQLTWPLRLGKRPIRKSTDCHLQPQRFLRCTIILKRTKNITQLWLRAETCHCLLSVCVKS